MKIKGLIIVCVILIAVLFGAIIIISHNATEPVDEEAVEIEEVEEELEDIEVLIKNSTGKKINTLYIFQDDNDDYVDAEGNQKWVELIDNKSFAIGDEETAMIERVENGGDWDFKVETDDGEYEMKETLGEDFIYDNATLEFIIVDGYLDVVDDGLTAEDVLEEDDEELDDEDYIEDEEDTEDEGDIENEEDTEDEDGIKLVNTEVE